MAVQPSPAREEIAMTATTEIGLLGRPVWYELVTTDMKAAEKFYSAVVGWTISPFDGGSGPYDLWTRTGGRTIGGVMPIPEGM
jgi:predicted enzyme related to lactoylglutathione lyase